jgi:hypothetical protein
MLPLDMDNLQCKEKNPGANFETSRSIAVDMALFLRIPQTFGLHHHQARISTTPIIIITFDARPPIHQPTGQSLHPQRSDSTHSSTLDKDPLDPALTITRCQALDRECILISLESGLFDGGAGAWTADQKHQWIIDESRFHKTLVIGRNQHQDFYIILDHNKLYDVKLRVDFSLRAETSPTSHGGVVLYPKMQRDNI